MIVKNESHIIKDTLTKLLNKVKIDYWVISDTGSTDNTPEIITEFFKEKNIEGELFFDEWQDFGYNRTKAIEHAYNKSDNVLIFDADDEIVGDFNLPVVIDVNGNKKLLHDAYHFQFGNANGTSYTRLQIVNNKKKWKYIGVLHEVIQCLEPHSASIIQGNYYVISGKSGSRSKDNNKYLKDALILETAYLECFLNNDPLYSRYCFYCANSYYDAGMFEKAIEFYLKTLNHENWTQEKYVSCLRLFNSYNSLNKKEEALYYAVKSFTYDKERVEGIYEVIKYYLLEQQHELAFNNYLLIKEYYENVYYNQDYNGKLFLNLSIPNFYLPYYMILVGDRVQQFDTVIVMFKMVFKHKPFEFNPFYVNNLLYNLQFFIERVKSDDTEFFTLFKEYINFLLSNGYPVFNNDFMNKYEKYGIEAPKYNRFSNEECSKSKKVLIYTGYSNVDWNYTFSLNNALGGSEKAVAYLSQYFPKDYEIYICGSVKEETIDNISYVNFKNLKNLVTKYAFHTVIVSRYIAFYEMFPEISFFQSYIWAHDICLFNYGGNLDVNNILNKWSNKINGCICQTEWHRNLYAGLYPELKDKFHIINNGISIDKFTSDSKKIDNRFIYTSCSERGLDRLLELWPQITEELPNAELFIASYNKFPHNDYENQLNEIIEKYDNIHHVGKLTSDKLYELMASSDYWLYPTNFSETSCITSMEMLMSQVICIYYPIAGLVNTVGDYGIPIQKGEEIETILNLTNKRKAELRRQGKEYALSCSWENRAKIWCDLLKISSVPNATAKRMFDLSNLCSMPLPHVELLKELSSNFTPDCIYDIGSHVLHWSKLAKEVWPNSQIIAFDAVKEVEELYKSYDIKYHLGIISDTDHKNVKFYKNDEHPAGNSYYKEIGHPNSENVYPEGSYIEETTLSLNTIVNNNNFKLPDLIKMNVQGAELDILKGGMNIINNAKYLIIELQSVQYNRDAPLAGVTIDYLTQNGWSLIKDKFSDNGPDADYLFINTNYNCLLNKELSVPILHPKIKVVNLKKREDRKQFMVEQFNRENIDNYEIIEAVDGNELKESYELMSLFYHNDFNYRKGVIGCALSHLKLWKQLINDKDNDFYVILEDDVEICEDFKEKLDMHCKIFQDNKVEHLALGIFGNEELKQYKIQKDEIYIIEKDVYKFWNITFAYIISKKAAKKILEYVNKCSIKCAIDNVYSYGDVIKYHQTNCYIAKQKQNLVVDSDIQHVYNCFNFSNVKKQNKLRIAYCDWWQIEYCGGTFDFNNNFITDILIKYGYVDEIIVVQPNEAPDVLFYSIFGNYHLNFPNVRRVFFSGEPFGISAEADFNITFDRNSDKNTRFPLWLGYLNDYLLEECHRRINGVINVPKRERFCSFISNGEVKTTHRRTIVDKLSQYKMVHCGGAYLNNIGYTVPRGINCSGKIEHNNNYKFAIAFENEDYPGYVSEKICDIYKSNCIPIYWGTKEITKDFNPSTFINANDFANFDDLVEYIIKVDNDYELYASYFKEPMFSPRWIDVFNNPHKIFYKNLAECIIGKSENLFDNFATSENNNIKIFNIWHNKLFDKCYKDLDEYSLSKVTMYDVNQNYTKVYNNNKKYNIIREYELTYYNGLYQTTNYCQTSCLYHVFKNNLYNNTKYIGFIQYDMELADDFIYDIEKKINRTETDIYFYSLTVADKIEVSYICNPYNNSILEKYNNYFNTNHTYETIKSHPMRDNFICLHTFVIPTSTFIKMMTWFCTITDWLHSNYISGIYRESMSEVTEEIFALFLLLQMIENDNIQLDTLKLYHQWPNLHNETTFNNYKEQLHYFSLDKIVDNTFTDKNTTHSYLETYEKLMKNKHLTCKNILEIGVQRGGSIKLWNDYFVNANIYGIDIDTSPDFLKEFNRVSCLKMNAYSQESISCFLEKKIEFDFIIHDGPNTLESILYFIKNYIQLLSVDGVMIIEDIQDIKWCEIFQHFVPEGYSYEIFDLRHVKNRWDDILLVIKKSFMTTLKNEYNIEKIKEKFNFECNRFSDINEHLTTLYTYAKECETIIECGVRGCVSSWALASGLIDNNKTKKSIMLNDLEVCDIDLFLNLTKNIGLNVSYYWCSDLDLQISENVDMTFIDTFHVYGQLKRELDKFSKITNKYIIMHDTTVDEIYGECIRSNMNAYELSIITGFPIEEINKGLQPAIDEFLTCNSEWILHEKYKNNNGLTILKKVN
jgi:FkbM family methyltransferase